MHSLNHLIQQADDWRVQWRFHWVELRVRAQSTDHLPDDLKQARQRNLDELRRYRQRGIFPRNRHHQQQMPVFIDPDGRHCAVAHLVTVSGHTDVAHTISQQANFARVPAMHFPQLDDWAQANGLTRTELARIQPAYGPDVTDPIVWAALVATAGNYLRILGFMLLVGIGSFICQIAAISRREPKPRWPVWMIVSGVMATLFSSMVIDNLLLAIRPLFKPAGPFVGNGLETIQYGMVAFASQGGLILGLVLVALGLLMLGIRYLRSEKQMRKVRLPVTQPE